MKVLDLFSGIGGFSLGLERAGMETVAFCEFDKKAQLVLKKHWPDVPIFDDVRELDGKQFEGQTIDLICGGFPCQPFSVAGKRKGKEDDRNLWPEYFRLIQEIKPRWVIGENVVNFANMGIETLYSNLESINYDVQTLDISADSVGLPTLERHLWIIATPHSIRCKRGISQKVPDITPQSWEFPRNDKGNFERWAVSQSRVCGMGKRFPGGVDRLKQLGNAVVPQVVEVIGRAIMGIETA